MLCRLQNIYVLYDLIPQGLLSNDSVLAGALWRNIFVKRDIEAEQVADMVEYVRQQVSSWIN